jgi:LysM repeat protein
MPFHEGHAACPFVAFEDDRDHRSESADFRHRCFASAEPEPRALPHQERFCLSSAFAGCPIFLDWARQEAAGVATRGGSTVSAGSTSLAAAGEVPARVTVKASSDDLDLLGRSRTTPAESTPRAARSADPGSGLWGFEGAPRRSVAPASAPQRVSTGATAQPAYSMARRAPTRPDWENPPRLDSFPRLRPRDDRNGNQPLMLLVLAITAIMVGLIVIPLLSGSGGGTAKATPTSSSDASASAEPTVTPTPAPSLSFTVYSVKKGDNLTNIANKYNVTPEMIIAANKGTQYEIKNPNVLLVNQKFFIPPPTWVIPTATSATQSMSDVPSPTEPPTTAP